MDGREAAQGPLELNHGLLAKRVQLFPKSPLLRRFEHVEPENQCPERRYRAAPSRSAFSRQVGEGRTDEFP